LRPTLEAAVLVAQQLEVSQVPTSLRQFLKFTRLPAKALDVTRRALDDDEFRMRVRDVVDRSAVGDAGWLLLDRPDGWAEELSALVGEAGRDEAETSAVAELAKMRRDLDRARAVADRAEKTATEATALVEQIRSARGDERARRVAAEERLGEVAEELERMRSERANAVRELKSTERRAAERAADLRAARERVRTLESELAAQHRQSPAPVTGPETTPEPDEAVESLAPPAPEPSPRQRSVDLEALAALIAEAAGAAGSLADALAAASALVRPELPGREPRPSPSPTSPSRRARRRPTPLPKGILDDSTDAARHLVAVDGMVLLVDGYNVSMRGWGDLTIALQRGRLIDAVAGLGARTGVQPVVVFDASEEVFAPRPAGRGVTVQFAPPDTEADDVIIAAVDDYPLDRPITVVSSDGRVRAGARRRGANVLTAEQLLALL
jgi:predicted RNA-binding protein with PIN domain